MSIPKEIREVERPINTVVVQTGKPGPKQFAVRERKGVKYERGKSPKPINGKVIGHIFEGKFIPLNPDVETAVPEFLSYGAARFAYSVGHDLIPELSEVFSLSDACKIFCIALLRAIKPTIPDSRLQALYESCWLSRLLPNIALSKNTVSSFLSQLGKAAGKRSEFFRKRIEKIDPSHHIAIDATLKQDSSKVNDLSHFSHKAGVKGYQDISVLYAYDIEALEPLCAQVFPGNSIDAGSYRSFVRDNKISKGVIVADEGFSSVKIDEDLKQCPDLHFLSPLKRNDSRIRELGLLEFDMSLEGMKNPILCKKTCANDKRTNRLRCYYAFKDKKLEYIEDNSFIRKAEKTTGFNRAEYEEKSKNFGVIVFESDLDMSAKAAYLCYQDRWLLELVFRHYKSDEQLDRARVQGDFSVMGSEFADFIATVITTRMVKQAEKCGVFQKFSYGEMMNELNSAWRLADAPEPAKSEDHSWVHVLKDPQLIMEMLGLSEPVQPIRTEPAKRGRKKKIPEFVGPKRPRGRPRKAD